MDVYDLTVPSVVRALGSLDRWLTLASAHERGEQLLVARLAADQYTLTRQVQTVADNAKMMVGRLAGRAWPSHPDTETTYAQLHARLESVNSFLDTVTREDFAGAGERRITLPWMAPDQWMHGEAYLAEFALPNFYFHLVTAYSILRHEGVKLGKLDYLGPITIRS